MGKFGGRCRAVARNHLQPARRKDAAWLRAWQVVFVAVVFSAQIVFSHWWLARFRYGPMEWVWRAFTYRQTPAIRIDGMAGGESRAVA